MRKHWKPILVLIAISIAFTELLTGNISIDRMVSEPVILPFLVILGYGLPVLLLREIFVRWHAGFPSMILLGLGYGIWNEGILAKTFLLNENVPIETYDGYMTAFGINIAWAFVIVAWHAFHAVIYPIFIVRFLYSEQGSTWLSKRTFGVMSFIVLSLGVLFFFREGTEAGELEVFGLMAGAMAGLFLAAFLLRKWQPVLSSSRPTVKRFAVYGAVFIGFLLLGISILAENAVATAGIVLAVLVLLAWVLWLFSKNGRTYPNIILFGLGDYILSGLFTMVFVGQEHPQVFVTVLVLELICILLFWRLWRPNR